VCSCCAHLMQVRRGCLSRHDVAAVALESGVVRVCCWHRPPAGAANLLPLMTRLRALADAAAERAEAQYQ